MNETKKVTYQEIASRAEVSLATISRVMHSPNSVKEETYERVLGAMQELGYDTSALTQRRATPSGGNLIILNLPTLLNPFYGEIVRGAKASALRNGYYLLVNEEHINDSTFSSCVNLIKKIKPAGVITLNHIPTELLLRLNSVVPLVQCCEYDETADVCYVGVDDFEASRSTMEYILSAQRRRVAFMNGPSRYKYARHRQKGYLSALQDHNIPVDKNLIIQLPEINYDMATSAAVQLLSSENRPDAFFTVSDIYASAVLRAAQRTGYRVPEDLMVVGFDNVEASAFSSPTITTVSQPKFQLGFTACEMLVEKIGAPDVPTRKVLLDTELIIRESTTL